MVFSSTLQGFFGVVNCISGLPGPLRRTEERLSDRPWYHLDGGGMTGSGGRTERRLIAGKKAGNRQENKKSKKKAPATGWAAEAFKFRVDQ
jgi:hypothetical protein